MKKKEFAISASLIFILIMMIAILNYVDYKRIEYKKEPVSLSVEEENYTEELIEEEDLTVFDNMTMEELADKLDRSLHSSLANTGYIYAKYSIEYGVDPYLAVAISLHETGCAWTCSEKVTMCNNVGGQRFNPTCYAGGTYGKYDTLEEGIKGFIANIAHNYIELGLTTPEAMQAKYVGTGSKTWAPKVNMYMEKIKSA